MTQPIQMHCSACGSTDVRRDAWAEWDHANQMWTLGATFDHAHCMDCDGETSLVERPLPTTGP